MKLTIEELELIQNVAEFNCIELSICEDYSGRGMCGDTTTGLVVASDTEFKELIAEVASDDSSLGRKLAKAKSDNLGLKYIYY